MTETSKADPPARGGMGPTERSDVGGGSDARATDARPWWQDAIGYEVYLRSFADGDCDGVGDFLGLTERLGHLADLGIDLVWVTPFYPSPQADFGYDVADYRDVDPVYGTLADFDRFLAKAKALGLRVLVDIVPNHSSSLHPWFRSAVMEGHESPYRDYYVWSDPAPDGGRPNNWLSMFGGPAWTLDERSGQYYMHLFLPEQPDLNWANDAVRDEFLDILRFWLDRGVDGFRIDVAHSLMEDQTFPDDPPSPDLPDGQQPETFGDLDHVYDLDREETVDIFRDWRVVADARDAVLIGEVYLDEPERVAKYVEGDALHESFYFGLNALDWDPAEFARRIRHANDTAPGGWSWVQGSHDEHRAVTRYGGGTVGRERSLALWSAMFGLPGTPFLYQGDELGLEDGIVAPEDIQDPVGFVSPEDGRDPCRTPIPWAPGPGNGFTTADEPWLRCEQRPAGDTVQVQRASDGSFLNAMRSLIAARRSTADRRFGGVEWWDEAPEGTLAFTRGSIAHVVNLTDEPVALACGDGWELVHATGTVELDGAVISLAPRTGTILAT